MTSAPMAGQVEYRQGATASGWDTEDDWLVEAYERQNQTEFMGDHKGWSWGDYVVELRMHKATFERLGYEDVSEDEPD